MRHWSPGGGGCGGTDGISDGEARFSGGVVGVDVTRAHEVVEVGALTPDLKHWILG